MGYWPFKSLATAATFVIVFIGVPIAYAQDDGLNAAQRALQNRITNCVKEDMEQILEVDGNLNRKTRIVTSNQGTQNESVEHSQEDNATEIYTSRCRK